MCNELPELIKAAEICFLFCNKTLYGLHFIKEQLTSSNVTQSSLNTIEMGANLYNEYSSLYLMALYYCVDLLTRKPEAKIIYVREKIDKGSVWKFDKWLVSRQTYDVLSICTVNTNTDIAENDWPSNHPFYVSLSLSQA